MIGCFPQLYTDELMYSWFARYYVQSGYTAIADAYVDLYDNKTVRPSIEMLNNLTYDAVQVVTKYASLQELALQHTMFPQFARFIDPDFRNKLISECDFMKGNWSNMIKIPFVNGKRYLRYCPLCVTEDREKYGEAYWHRRHQITGIKICTKHRVFLKDSMVSLDKYLTRFKAAEIVITDSIEYEKCNSQTIVGLADYLEAVFLSNKYSHKGIGRFLDCKLNSFAMRGNGDRAITSLYGSYKSFYRDLEDDDLMKIEYIPRLLKGQRNHFYYVCQMAFFAGITPMELLNNGDEYMDKNLFFRISKNVGEPVELVEKIGKAILAELKTNKESSTREIRYMNYLNEEDERLLPRVKEIIKESYGFDDLKPHKISAVGISKELGVYYHKFKRLPMCFAEVQKYYESQEEFWARKLIWTINQIEKNDEKLTLKRVNDYAHIKRPDVMESLSALKAKDKHVYNVINTLFNKETGN